MCLGQQQHEPRSVQESQVPTKAHHSQVKAVGCDLFSCEMQL